MSNAIYHYISPMYFDGSNTCIMCPYNSLFNSYNITLELWFITEKLDWQQLILQQISGSDVVLEIQADGKLLWKLSAMGTDAIRSEPLEKFKLYHVVACVDETTMYLYINGELIGSKSLYYAPRILNTQSYSFGHQAGSLSYFKGSMFVAAIYNVCWSASSVANRYANMSQNGIPSDCVLFYRSYDMTSYTSITDKSGNGNTGTIYNMIQQYNGRMRNARAKVGGEFLRKGVFRFKTDNSWGRANV